MTNSHVNCSHPITKAARAKCRKERAAGESHRAFARHASEAHATRLANARASLSVDPFELLPKPIDIQPELGAEDDWADTERTQWDTDSIGYGDADLND